MFCLNDQRNFESFAAVIQVCLSVGMNILATSIVLIRLRITSVYDVLVYLEVQDTLGSVDSNQGYNPYISGLYVP